MPIRHVLLAIAVTVVWGVNFVVIHVALGDFPPLLFVPRPRVPLRWVLGVGLFMSAGQFSLLFVAMSQGLPAGLASLVLQLQVPFTIVLAVAFLGERLRATQVAGSIVALAGIAVIAAGRAHGVPLGALALCIAAGASWGIGNICNRRAQAPDAIALLVWSSVVTPLPLAVLSLALEGSRRIGDALTGLHASGVLALLYVVIVSTVFGYGSWTWLMRHHPASRVAPFTLLVPPIGIATAWIALGERPTVSELAGGVVVLAGIALVTSAVRTGRTAAEPLPATS
jgi:O-acetylserine/cysteine efflux transporter